MGTTDRAWVTLGRCRVTRDVFDESNGSSHVWPPRIFTGDFPTPHLLPLLVLSRMTLEEGGTPV